MSDKLEKFSKFLNAVLLLSAGASLYIGMAVTFRQLSGNVDPVDSAERVAQLVYAHENEYPLEDIRVVDGDTIEADIKLPLRITLDDEMIRFSDYDAWESSKRRRSVDVTDGEVEKGKIATRLLISLIEGNRVALMLSDGERDVYGRVLGRAIVYKQDGSRVEVMVYMKENGMLRNDDGGERENINSDGGKVD